MVLLPARCAAWNSRCAGVHLLPVVLFIRLDQACFVVQVAVAEQKAITVEDEP